MVLGEGGHTKEMVTLADMLGGDLEYGYLIVQDDVVSEAMIRQGGPVYRVLRPRDKRHCLPIDLLKGLYSGWQSFRALRDFRPQAILSTRPSVAVPVSALARLLGIKVIFVETGSRVTALSTTGRIMYRLANLFFVQWPGLLERHPRAIYAGRLF